MVALLLVVYVGYTIYVSRVLFIITISIDHNWRSVATSTYIVGNGLKLSRMRLSFSVNKLLLGWTIYCGEYIPHNGNHHFRSY